MTQQCAQCSKTFQLNEADLAFLNNIDVPQPKLCWSCGEQRRLVWRNEHSLYQGKCAKCGTAMISSFSKDKPNNVYCNTCWWSDQFDAREFAQEYDENRPFFEQLDELMKKAAVVNIAYANSENSEYTNFATDNKNCYLVAASDFNEDSMYSSYIFRSRDCIDCLFINDCDSCYQLVDCENCYGSKYLQNCKQCIDCEYGYDLQNCSNCFGCVGLRHKEYHIFNKAYSKEEYVKKVAELKQNLPEVYRQLEDLKLKHPHKFAHNLACNSCTGDYLTKSETCHQCFDTIHSVNGRYSALAIDSKDFMRTNGAISSELIYESVGIPGDNNIKFSVLIWPKSSYLEYCLWSRASNNCFGCVGLNKNQYCILNKQYTEAEYKALRNKIITKMNADGEWGEFMPITISPFGYNETAAQDYYPLTKEQTANLGYAYKEPEDVVQSSAAGVIVCEVCTRPFRLTKQEIEFYRRHNIAYPTKCFNDRRVTRLAQRNPRSLWQRQCMCTQPTHKHGNKQCAHEFETTYSPERKELVYCEDCYNSEIV